MNSNKSVIRLRTPEEEPATPLRDRAAEDLSFIRATMERATAFTLVPGLGGVGMGLTGLRPLGSRRARTQWWNGLRFGWPPPHSP